LNIIHKLNKYDFTKEKWYEENMIDNIYEVLIDFFNKALDNNIRVIRFNTKIKLNFELNKKDWIFLNKGSDFNVSLNEKFPKNINFLKSELFKDLFILDSLKGLAFLILLPKEKNNIYYYDLILGFDNNYNINEVVNLKLNLVNINGFCEWSKIDVDEIKLRQIFDFGKIKFYDWRITSIEADTYHIDMRRFNREQYKKITFRKLCNHFYSYNLIIDDLHAELADYFMSYNWLFACVYSCFIPEEIMAKMHKELGITHILDDLEKIEKEIKKHTIDIVDKNKK
jgi:hypothetical protein